MRFISLDGDTETMTMFKRGERQCLKFTLAFNHTLEYISTQWKLKSGRMKTPHFCLNLRTNHTHMLISTVNTQMPSNFSWIGIFPMSHCKVDRLNFLIKLIKYFIGTRINERRNQKMFLSYLYSYISSDSLGPGN